ncbi:MAG: pilin [Plesiomonas sp.]
MNKMKQGFTLIELMIVVAVIGVLAAIAIPQYQNYVAKAELGSALSTLASLKTNVEDHIANQGKFPTSTSDIGAPNTAFGSVAFASNVSGIKITMGQSATANPKVKDAVVVLIRKSDDSWACQIKNNSTSSVISAMLPKGCVFGTEI